MVQLNAFPIQTETVGQLPLLSSLLSSDLLIASRGGAAASKTPLTSFAPGVFYSSWLGASSALADNSVQLLQADALAGAGGQLVLTGGVLKVTENISLSSQLVFQPGTMLQPASGVTISINGQVSALQDQIFDCSQGGTIAGTPQVTDAWSEWFGAKPGNYSLQPDQSVFINLASNWLAQANGQGSAEVGYGRANLRFQPLVYFISTETVNFLPFINYIGVRATTADSGSNLGILLSSRGTILRGTPALYTNNSTGIITNVATGDITLKAFQIVGTTAINGNPSIGINWGAGTSGIYGAEVTIYTCTTAEVLNGIGDAHFTAWRHESNTIDYEVNSAFNQMHVDHAEFFAASNVITFVQGCGLFLYLTNTQFDFTATGYLLQVNDGVQTNMDILFGSGCVINGLTTSPSDAIDMRGSGGAWGGTFAISGTSGTIDSTSVGSLVKGMRLNVGSGIPPNTFVASVSGTAFTTTQSCTVASGTAGSAFFKQKIRFDGATLNNVNIQFKASGSGDAGTTSCSLRIGGATALNGVEIFCINRGGLSICDSDWDESYFDSSLGSSLTYTQLNGNRIANLPLGGPPAIKLNSNMAYNTMCNNLFVNVASEFGNQSDLSSSTTTTILGNQTDSGNVLPVLMQALPSSSSVTGGAYTSGGGTALNIH